MIHCYNCIYSNKDEDTCMLRYFETGVLEPLPEDETCTDAVPDIQVYDYDEDSYCMRSDVQR